MKNLMFFLIPILVLVGCQTAPKEVLSSPVPAAVRAPLDSAPSQVPKSFEVSPEFGQGSEAASNKEMEFSEELDEFLNTLTLDELAALIQESTANLLEAAIAARGIGWNN